MSFSTVCKDIFRFEDSCAVYVIKNGEEAVLIDFGSGKILRHLSEIGVKKINAVCLTVPQRNHCQGLRFLETDAPVYYPSEGKRLIESNIPVHGNSVRFPAFSPAYELPDFLKNPAAFPASGIKAGAYTLTAMRVGGFMNCQSAFFLDSEDDRICFSGDAIYAPGKIYTGYAFEHIHYTGTGQFRGVESLRQIRLERPGIICPSHGTVIKENVYDALTLLMKKLYRLAELYDSMCLDAPASRRIRSESGEFRKLSEHIWMRNNIYVVLSKDKKAILIDFFETSDEAVRSFIQKFETAFPDTDIETIFVTHCHYDHWQGINELRKYKNFETVCSEYLKGPLENPIAYRRPFQQSSGIKIDKAFENNTLFHWHEYDFTIFELPGQTDFHSGYFAVIDGRRVFFTGDDFYPVQQWGGTGGLSSFNGGNVEFGWKPSIELVIKQKPDWILASHLQPFEYSHADFSKRLDWANETLALMKDLTPAGWHYRLSFDQNIFKVFPYSQPAASSFNIDFTVCNPSDETVAVTVVPQMPEGLSVKNSQIIFELPPKSEKTRRFEFSAEQNIIDSAAMIRFDITWNDIYLGERFEAFVF